jgi:hypothetical protein
MQTDHHDVIHASFRNGANLGRYVDDMARAGFPLPTDVPDQTFKTPNWMNGREPSEP